jgi:nucleoside-diphosphate-sugar epimerase
MTTLVVGTGFVGSELATSLRNGGIEVTQTSRQENVADVTVAHGAALDNLLANSFFDQVVVVGQLTSANIDWVLERIEGPHWLVLSSQQLTATTPAPQERLALAREDVCIARGACVLRATMIYGRGRDLNLTRAIRIMRRWRVPLVPGSGSQLIQPLHVDDLIELIKSHRSGPRT